MFIKDTIAFNIRNDINNENCEILFINVLLPKSKPFIVGMCYRPPDDSNFCDKLENNILSIKELEQETYILGDFNINYCKANNSSLMKSLKRVMTSLNLDQLVKSPTRISPTSSTIIDLIFTSNTSKVNGSGVINSGISDHCMIYCTRKLTKDYFGKHNNVKLRSLKNYDKNDFVSQLNLVDWSSVIYCDNVNLAWSNFKKLFMSVLDKVAPIKQVRLKQKSEMWFSSEIVNLISLRDQAFNKYVKTKSSEHHDEFKRLRNLTQRSIKTAKQSYVKDHIENNSGNIKKLWKSIKNLGFMGKVKAQNINIGLKNVNGEVVFEKKFVADKFNSFFCGIAEKLVNLLPPKDKVNYESVGKFYSEKNVTPNKFKFEKMSENEIFKVLDKIDPNKAKGLDDISAKFVKDSAKVICNPICYIVNLSFELNTFPDEFKQAKVIPLYKKGDKNYEGNYRPVSILPVLSKVFERVAHNQIDKYLCNNNVLYNNQSGFRSSYSTDTALTYLSDTIRHNMDKGNLTGLILLDLQKAFDTVNHLILTNKLKHIGFKDNAIKWVESYLSGRRQFVEIGGISSEPGIVNCGVPQGSILGPLLFLLYINDMSTAINDQCSLYLYADDSALAVSGNNVTDIESKLSFNMNNVSLWLSQNRLSLHLGKTECILFGSKNKVKNVQPLNITCNNNKLQVTKCVKYL